MKNTGRLSNVFAILSVVALSLGACSPAPVSNSTPTSTPTAAAAQASPVSPAPTTAAPRPTPPTQASARPAEPASPPQQPAPEKPAYGGTLALTLSADPPSLDFNGENTANVWEPVRATVESIVRRNAWKSDIPIEGHLAKSWDVSKDGTVITFKFQPGIKWQDGSSFSADDVKFTFERYARPPQGVKSVWMAQLKPIKEAKVVNDTTLQLILNQSTAALLDSLTYIPIYSKKWIEGGGDPKHQQVGTGPFKLQSYTPSASLQFVRNATYWQEGKPYLDGLTWHIVADRATRFAALRTGRVRVASARFSQLTPGEKTTLEQDKLPVRLWPTIVQGSPYMIFNMKAKPFSDVRIRRAIHLATDRAQARTVLFEGAGRPGFWFTYSKPPGIPLDGLMKLPGFREDTALKQQDMAEAKRLMAEAGYPNGFKATITSRPLADFKNAAVFRANELNKIGIQANVEVLGDAEVFARFGRGDFQMGELQGTTNLRPDPADNASLWFLPTSGLNWSRFDDEEFVKAYNESGGITDPVERSKLVRKMEERLIDVMPGIHLGFFYGYLMAWNDVKNWPEFDRAVDANVLPNVWMSR